MRAAASAADALTPQWLSKALGRRVRGHRVEPMKEQGVSGSLSRVHFADGTTLIAKQGPTDPVVRGRQRAFGMYTRELAFYRDIATRVPLRTPACAYIAPNDLSPVFLLMEDLAPAVAGSFTVGLAATEASDALDAMGAMHGAWWGSRELDALGLWRVTVDEAARWATDLADRLPRFLDRYRARLTIDEIRLAESLTERLAWCILEAAALPATLSHGDPGCPNLMFGHPSASVAFVDWQLVAARNGFLDVAWLVVLGVPRELRQRMEPEWLSRYCEAVGVGIDDGKQSYALGVALALRAPIWMGGAPPSERTAHTDAYAESTLARAFSAAQELHLASLLAN